MIDEPESSGPERGSMAGLSRWKGTPLLLAGVFAAATVCVCRGGDMARKAWSGTTGNENVEPLTKHWEKVIPYQAPPEDLSSISAEECGECHEDIYAEWKSSFHAVAWEDPQFQSEWAKGDSLWVCINCHIPLENQQPYIVTGKIDGDYFRPVKRKNPRYDPLLREESITCAVCHIRDGAVIGPFADPVDAPHVVKQDTVFLSRRICFGCHNVTDVIDRSLVCVFNTGNEWNEGPYRAAGRDCIVCHMPEIERPLVAGGPIRKTRKHTWIGSGIPKYSAGEVEEVAPVPGYVRAMDVRVHSSRELYGPGDDAYLSVTLINQRAGHTIPTGDPEYFYTLRMDAVDTAGRSLKSVAHRIGQEWTWWPAAEKTGDNRLDPLESRTYSFMIRIPDRPERIRFEVRLVVHRITGENAAFNDLPGHYPLSALIFEKTMELNR